MTATLHVLELYDCATGGIITYEYTHTAIIEGKACGKMFWDNVPYETDVKSTLSATGTD